MSDEHKKDVDAYSGVDTTGHEWDGIKELDNPLPRWWVWVFYASIVWSVIYWVFMPSWPGLPGMDGHLRGVRDHSERANVAVAIAELEESRAPMFTRLTEAADTGGISAIEADPDLLNFALAAGSSAFGDNCATCHGAGGQGFIGYPNLNDDVWLWGGSFDDIRHTLHVGIRWENNPDTRFSQMPAYGRDELLSREEISAVTDYVMTLSDMIEPTEAGQTTGAEIFEFQCSACHGANGMGDRMQGAPNLTDQEWLYGGTREQISNTIWRGPYGMMPAWEGRLDEEVITALAAYVYLLGGGESDGAYTEASAADAMDTLDAAGR
ncbi:MAG: cytochrome-c oxidase, cbb3-type subunit III [Oceanicaulis sp.]|jgi:cytochrome c oxidase cbb3-type subunit 3|nr:cytochrome-c oxidase, cbb3-type subunit III [Oceanicaulis sp.]